MTKRLAPIIAAVVGLIALVVVGVYYRRRALGDADPRGATKPAVEPLAHALQRVDAGTNVHAPSVAAVVTVPSGTFTMGTHGEGESRPRRVHVEAFEIDVTEVTVEAYQSCVAAGACAALTAFGTTCNVDKPALAQHPINCVDASQAETYCRWAGKRLPSEEEWEFAARGSDGRTFPWGNGEPSSLACWRRAAENRGTCAAGAFPAGASPFGVQDMAGNLWEWTATPLNRRPDAPRVVRGGGWATTNPAELRSTLRGRWQPDERLNVVGFRCVRSVSP
jgi:sulfatase modifying factor 1